MGVVRQWMLDGQDLLLESDENLAARLRLTHDGLGMSESLALRLPSGTGGLDGGYFWVRGTTSGATPGW